MTDNPDKVHPAEQLLSEGLDLCVRARKLDEQHMRAIEAGMGRTFPGDVRCATPAIWAQDQYEKDLADWESRARKYLTERSQP